MTGPIIHRSYASSLRSHATLTLSGGQDRWVVVGVGCRILTRVVLLVCLTLAESSKGSSLCALHVAWCSVSTREILNYRNPRPSRKCGSYMCSCFVVWMYSNPGRQNNPHAAGRIGDVGITPSSAEQQCKPAKRLLVSPSMSLCRWKRLQDANASSNTLSRWTQPTQSGERHNDESTARAGTLPRTAVTIQIGLGDG